MAALLPAEVGAGVAHLALNCEIGTICVLYGRSKESHADSQKWRLVTEVGIVGCTAEGSSEGAAKPAEGNRPGQKSGKVVFGATGNRLLDKKLAAEKPKAPKPEVRLMLSRLYLAALSLLIIDLMCC